MSTRFTPWKYPSADLRRLQKVIMEVALLLALVLVIVLFRAPLYPRTEFVIEQTRQESIKVEEIPQTEQQVRPPPPPRPLPPVEVPDETILEEEVPEFESELQLDKPLEIPPPPPPPEEEQEEEAEPEIFVIVEEMPEIIGGQAATRTWNIQKWPARPVWKVWLWWASL